MAQPFRTRIRSALANPGLQAALDGNAERRIAVRKKSLDSLPNVNELKQQAHELRMEVVENLEQYVEQFTRQAQKNGWIVHLAPDAKAARELVLEIARQHHVTRVAKAKTMLGEEIELNHALEQAGIQVVETDLGEYIVQLRGERPGHIITPAIHLSRQEVGQTFHEKLGIPVTDDIPTLTAAARRTLRQVFLEAEMGISGANMGVVETGGICLVTNEGNGRMVTTLPPVHVALMGMERLVPTLDDLALLLQLLPRSATGQSLSVYTSLIHRPRQAEETEGPRERHLVLVDNGRLAIRRSPLAEILLCIRCGACLNACPVFRELGGHAYVSDRGEPTPYPGPLGSVLSPALYGPDFANLARASTLCGACAEACPAKIDLPGLLLRVRSGDLAPDSPAAAQEGATQTLGKPNAPRTLSLGLKVFALAAARPRLFAFAQKMGAQGLKALSARRPGVRLPAWTGWGFSKDFPAPSGQLFREWWAARPAETHPSGKVLPPAQPAPLAAAEKAPVQAVSAGPERFQAEIVALGGCVTFCGEGEAADAILRLLDERGIRRVQSWKAGEGLLPTRLVNALTQAGIEMCFEAEPEVQAGLTGAIAALADTGTLVVPGGKGRPLSASLVPPVHIAVLPVSKIYASFPALLADRDMRQQIVDAPAAAWISGPSRTADIEMALTIGVHGPMELHIYCLTADE